MPKPRCEIVSLDVSPYYHCTSRCVRRDVCSYAVMSNHYHVVLHVDQEKTAAWDLKTLIQLLG